MKFNFIIVILFSSVSLHGQTYSVQGIVTDSKNNPIPFSSVWLFNNDFDLSTNCDSTGHYKIKPISSGTYKISASAYDCYKSDTLTFSIEFNDILKDLSIDLEKKYSSVKYCPHGHEDNIIPIVYGKPSKNLVDRAKKGEIEIGGCIITECSPKWYCQIHQLSF